MKKAMARVFLAVILLCSVLSVAYATVAMTPPFGNNMVLQREKAVPVWGTAAANKTITVSFNDQVLTTTSDSSGNWQVILAPMAVKTTGGSLIATETGANTVTFTGILVGDVWVCSGQSNMDWTLGSCDRQVQDVNTADFPGIRLFRAPLVTSAEPTKTLTGSWSVCTPGTAASFSAVGFYFARKIYQEHNSTIPIGLYVASVGGTRIDPWLAPDGCTDIPTLAPLFSQAVLPWGPFALFNGMVYPYSPLPAKGLLWYQGENSETTTQSVDSYYLKMKALAQGYKRLLGMDDFAFYFVQLAYWGATPSDATPVLFSGGWDADTRLQQTMSMALPHAGMASALDIGDSGDYHPKDKLDVGDRLALWALKNDYGQNSLVTSGPILRDVTVSGNKLICSFDYVGSGLMVGSKIPYQPTQEVIGGTLQKFSIAGATGSWYTGVATIVGDTLEITSPSVPEPRKVAYACWQNPIGANFYNKEGLPASPFYVDDVDAKYTVTATAGTGGTISPAGATTFLKRMTALYTITPDEGYYVQDVLVDGVSVGAQKYYTFDPLYADHTISATFATTVPTYTITTSAASGGVISPSGTVSIAQGGSQTFTITPYAGSAFTKVLIDGKSVGLRKSYTFTDVRTNHTISANFSHIFSTSNNFGGVVSPSGKKYVAEGVAQGFSVTPMAGYSLIDVKLDGVSMGPITNYIVPAFKADHTVTATFAGSTGGSGSIPKSDQIILAALPSALPESGSTGDWNTYLPSGSSLTAMGTPTVEDFYGRTWEKNIFTEQDGFVFGGSYSAPITCNGATIVVAVKPNRYGSDTVTGSSVVDVFYDRLVLGLINSNGRIYVRRNGITDFGNAILDGQITVLSLVVQPDGTYKVWSNGSLLLSKTTLTALTSLVPGTGSASYINIGRNHLDGANTFNGNIGDVFVYKTALTDAERLQLERYLINKLTDYTITASAGAGGSISPVGKAVIMSGTQPTYIMTPSAGYGVADVTVDGVSVGAVGSYTFNDLNASHTIAATFTQSVDVANISDLKGQADGTAVKLTGPATVIYAPKNAGTRSTTFFYIGEAQGRGGLKVVDQTGDALSIGNLVSNLIGYVRKPAGKEVYLELSVDPSGSGSSPIAPIGLNNKGALLDAKALTNAVKVWGKVKSVNGTTSFVISDGYSDSGVTVMVNGVQLPAIFDTTKTAVITGILTRSDDGSLIVHAQEVSAP